MNIDIVIVGDKYSDLTQKCVESIENTTTGYNLFIEDWVGCYNESLNNGIKKGSSEYVALCNNDLVFLSQWKEKALEALKSFNSVSPSEPKIHANLLQPKVGFTIAYELCGWCIITTRKLLESIGYLDQRVTFWGSDDLYGKQLQKKRYTHAVIPNSKVIHLGSQTLNTMPKHIYRELTVNQYRKALRLNR